MLKPQLPTTSSGQIATLPTSLRIVFSTINTNAVPVLQPPATCASRHTSWQHLFGAQRVFPRPKGVAHHDKDWQVD
ncbi:hypothetical protein ARSEF1564_002451 [Beauveria bassiana]